MRYQELARPPTRSWRVVRSHSRGPSPLRQGATAASVIVLIPAIRAVRSSLS
jgi:hypothetical protein